MVQRWPKMAPRWPKMAQDAPKMAPRWPKMAPRWPQDDPRGAQVGPKRGPKMVPNRSSEAFQHRRQKRETDDKSEMPILRDFGPLLGPIQGLCWAPERLLNPLKTMKMRNIKMLNKRCKIHVGLALGASKRGPCWGHVGVKLAS